MPCIMVRNALAREEQRKSEKRLADAAVGATPTNAFLAGAVSRDESGGVVEGGARESSWAVEAQPAQPADAGDGTAPTNAFMAEAVSRDESGGVVEGGARESSWAMESNPLAA